jgi:Na+:H+ antiporter, NhaC family
MPLAVALLPFGCTIALLLLANFVFHVPLYLGLLGGWVLAFLLAIRNGFRVSRLLVASYQGLQQTSVVVVILVLIGGVIAVWEASGTVAGLIVFSSHYIIPTYLVVTAFLLATGMSMLLGTSVGTLSTIGVVLVGMAQLNQIPLGLIGGALLSGAMVGDRTSPLSGTVHVLGTVAGVKPESSFKWIVRSALPVFIICLVAYTILGFRYAPQQTGLSAESTSLRLLREVFHLNGVVLLPPLLVMILALVRVPIRLNLALGLLFGVILCIWIQGMDGAEVVRTIWNGSRIVTPEGRIVFQGGGVWNMLNQVLIILCAGAFNGLLEATGIMDRLVGELLKRTTRQGSLILETVGLSLVSGLVFCNQALMVILPGNMLRGKYEDLGMDKVELVRTLSDSGVVASALIPWNLHGILCSTAIGIHTTTYDPYAFFLWGLPLLAIARGVWRNRNIQAARFCSSG